MAAVRQQAGFVVSTGAGRGLVVAGGGGATDGAALVAGEAAVVSAGDDEVSVDAESARGRVRVRAGTWLRCYRRRRPTRLRLARLARLGGHRIARCSAEGRLSPARVVGTVALSAGVTARIRTAAGRCVRRAAREDRGGRVDGHVRSGGDDEHHHRHRCQRAQQALRPRAVPAGCWCRREPLVGDPEPVGQPVHHVLQPGRRVHDDLAVGSLQPSGR